MLKTLILHSCTGHWY